MRPVGEIRAAILHAAQQLATPDRGPTLQELAAQACVGIDAAMQTVKNMTRYGVLTVPRTRKVDYRNRPVAEYAPAAAEPPKAEGFVDMATLLNIWARG